MLNKKDSHCNNIRNGGIRLSAVLAFLLALGVGVFGAYKAVSSSVAETRSRGVQHEQSVARNLQPNSVRPEVPRSQPSATGVGFVARNINAELPQLTTGLRATKAETRLTPIERLQVGQRVRADAPTDDVDLQFGHQVITAEWRKLTLTAPKKNGTLSDVVLLRPLRWIEHQRAEVDGQVYISVPECGIDGNATVHSIEPCPPIIDGPGEVITGTFRHRVSGGIELSVEGESQPIRCTGNHPIWSEDRHDFVRADSLQPGETLRTVDGLAKVVASNPLPGETYVYNIEVHRAHVYHVGNEGLLVHNGGLSIVGGPCFVPKSATKGWTEFAQSGAADNVLYHFMKHGDDVGAKNVVEYSELARSMYNHGTGWRFYKQVYGNIDNVSRLHKGQYFIDVDFFGNIVSFGLRQ